METIKKDMRTVTLQIDEEIYTKLAVIANEEDRSISSVIRKALKDYIIKKEASNED